MSTPFPSAKQIERRWFVVDAEGQVLGRMATSVARLLMGKHKPMYTPFLDCGDHVIVINAAKVTLTGNKLENKTYYRHTGYPGGIKAVSARRMMEGRPDRVVEKAVYGMLPKGRLGRQMRKKLKVYVGAEHLHAAQRPEPYAGVGG